MSDSTVTVESPEGDKVDIKFDEMNDLDRLSLVSGAPEEFKDVVKQATELDERGLEPNYLTIGPVVIGFVLGIIERQTVLTRGMVAELSMKEIQKLVVAALQQLGDQEIDVSAVEEMHRSTDDYRLDGEDFSFDLSEDGTLDLDDWR